ncbi:bifunctional DNA primase/polymerase [Nesterenkonia sp. HG001]|uniref:bifunctional DNA primase/polymerase n=1 Tax=Nesterenkonia sp. HG001 TaxID=2983207 RepID=UPI002AC72D9F|nr:bifunctional DNA primase/polymerase [Nesterenkonia sp. HG001]MDZ5078850.1 bifunctional DNA primase/polymerase [Nesterenkonia sp. HG001]
MMAATDALAGVLSQRTGPWPVSAAARELATAGVPVFPCVPGGKRPLTEHGFHDATTDPGQVEAWWRAHPDANLAVPTGAASGMVVVDVDVHGPVNGFASFGRAHRAGLVSRWAFLVSTPSGGMHVYYPATPERAQRSWQAARAGVDFRGDGGYILLPPSMVSTNGAAVGYQVRQVNTGSSARLDSDRLRDFLDPRPTAPPSTGDDVERSVDVSRLAAWVAARVEGERNRGLFWAACRLAENGVPAPDALDVLAAAASEAGLGEREITTTVRSAYRTTQPQARPSSPVQGSARAADGWFAREATVRPSAPGRRLS